MQRERVDSGRAGDDFLLAGMLKGLPRLTQVGFGFAEDFEDGLAIVSGEFGELGVGVLAGEDVVEALQEAVAHHAGQLVEASE